MLSHRITMLFDLLGCNNSDIARAIGCSASNISRIHSESRVYKPYNRPILRFADGVYTFADKNNMLSTLTTLCKTESESRAQLVTALIAWLFDTDKASLPQINIASVQNKTAVQKAELRSFGEKLDDIMSLIEMSNIRLARQINVDASHISRFRSGVRSPHSNTALSNTLALALIKRATEQNCIPSIAKLTSISADVLADSDEGVKAFSDWLYNVNGETDTSDIDNLLDCIDSFSPEEKMPLPELSAFITNKITHSSATEYWGVDGLREAVLRFLSNSANGGSEIWLYSDENINWMVEDTAFFAKWYALMLNCVKCGVKVKIIHNLDRGTEEMIAAIKSWLPLYMSGKIDSYVCTKSRDARFTHTLFLCPGVECIYANHIKGTEKDGWYEYLSDKKKLSVTAIEYNKLLNQCEPLIKIYTENSYKVFTENQNNGSILSLLSGLSLGTMPNTLVEAILKRNGITGSRAERITEFCHTQQKLFKDAIAQKSVCEFVFLPRDDELFDGKVPINLSPLLSNCELYYTAEEYAVHIKAIIDLLKNNTAYRFYTLPQMPFPDIQIVCQGEQATVIRAKKPCAAFVFTQPYMLRAFESYFDLLKNKYKCDRSEVRQSLKQFL